MNERTEDTKVEAMLRGCETKGMRGERKSSGVVRLPNCQMGGEGGVGVTCWSRAERLATSSLHWDRLEVSVRSISTTVLTFFHLTSFISVFVGRLEAPQHVQSDITHTHLVWTAAYESTNLLPRTWPKRGHSCHTPDLFGHFVLAPVCHMNHKMSMPLIFYSP